MSTIQKPNFELINHDFTIHQVLVKDNVYLKEWHNGTLLELLEFSLSPKHKSTCQRLSSCLLDVDPGYGFWANECDQVLVKLKENFEYKDQRRKNLKLVKYLQNIPEGCQIALVIIDIDFKDTDEIYLDQLNYWQSKVTDYYMQHDASIFLIKSASGLGFHLAMSFHGENVTKDSYTKAYEFYANEMCKIIEIPNFMSHVDFSVAHIGADFFLGNCSIGSNGEMHFKNPTMSLKILNDETKKEVEISHVYSVDSYHADFLLTHYFDQIPEDCRAFTEYDKWIKMTFALVVTFKKFKSRAYYWFEKFSQFADQSKINKEENDSKFEEIFNLQLSSCIGINYLFKEIFGAGYAKNYVPYSFEQVWNYFEQNQHLLQFNDSPITNDFDQKCLIKNYISEQSEVLTNDKNILLIAPPNSGKSHYYLNQPNVIFLAPTSILRDDLCSNNPRAFKIQVQEEIIPNQQNYIGNYDAIFKMVNSVLNLKDYTLVIDEAHELFFSAHPQFRHRTVRKIVSSLGKFKNFVMLTGTPFQFNLGAESFETYYFTKSVNRSPQLEIVSTPKPLQTMAQEILAQEGKQICFINNKELINKLYSVIKDAQPNRNVIIFSSLTKDDVDQQLVLKMNLLPHNTIVLGTQMILEGISFKDEDITHLRFYQPILAEYIAQFSFRPRNETKPPLMVMYTKPKDYRHQKDAFPITAYKTLEEKYLGLLENIKNNGIESEPIELQIEQHYRRLSLHISNKDAELLPIILLENSGYELDRLFLGQLATDLANKKSSIDIFSVLVQLQKWNFKFIFRQAESSGIFTSFNKQSKSNQKNIIENDFQNLILRESINPDQKVLYRAHALCQFVNASYFLNFTGEKRYLFFSDVKILKSAILKVGVWAKENKLYNPHLSDLISDLDLNHLISMVLIVKRNNSGNLISHQQLMDWLDMPQTKIKETKSKLKLYFNIKDDNKNSLRSVMLLDGDFMIIDAINKLEFKDEEL